MASHRRGDGVVTAESGDPAAAREAFTARVVKATEFGKPLNIVGGATKNFYGRTAVGDPLPTAGFRGIVEYEPAELVATVRAGTTLKSLQAVLASERQMLAFEPPAFGEASTIGGVVAAGLSGPRRPYAGAVRDAVLGIELMTGNGDALHFGGRVMKNVAGYDVSRLVVGAMGTLGLILTVSVKVVPRAEIERTVTLQCDSNEAYRCMVATAAKPWPVTAMAYCDGTLRVRLSGNADAVDEAAAALGGDDREDHTWWAALNNHILPFFNGADPLWRLSVPPASDRIDLPGEWLCDWGGALRWLKTDAPTAAIREQARRAGGHATLFRGTTDMPFTPLDPVSKTLHQRLKKTFDAAGVFNPGRMYPDL